MSVRKIVTGTETMESFLVKPVVFDVNMAYQQPSDH